MSWVVNVAVFFLDTEHIGTRFKESGTCCLQGVGAAPSVAHLSCRRYGSFCTIGLTPLAVSRKDRPADPTDEALDSTAEHEACERVFHDDVSSAMCSGCVWLLYLCFSLHRLALSCPTESCSFTVLSSSYVPYMT
ncbi:hypothetical protein GOODEAATRI_024468 [Goodea atripinnis]|uniref:Uncharacterized protein n=1 Tax=Goodea atripinnis TaxID=208336 RepID=A0ABV0PRA3_9TELE